MSGLPSMTYARNLLEKYGWAEGRGLGKTENGMVEALKPKLKFDNTGIGHDHAEQFTNNWWEVAFNEAAKRVSVDVAAGESNALVESPDLCISTKRASVTKLMKDNPLKYGKFIKTETLTSGGKVIPLEGKVTSPVDSECSTNSLSNLTDEELLRICGGRTAHKAARHGNKLVGKLARVTEQEKQLVLTSGSTKNKERDQVKDDGSGNYRKKRKVCYSDVGENGQQSDSPNCDLMKNSGLNGVVNDSNVVDSECKVKRKKKKDRNKEVSGSGSEYLNCEKKLSRHSGGSSVNENNCDSVVELGNGADDRQSSKRKKKKRSR